MSKITTLNLPKIIVKLKEVRKMRKIKQGLKIAYVAIVAFLIYFGCFVISARFSGGDFETFLILILPTFLLTYPLIF